jgi:hypothetical protein
MGNTVKPPTSVLELPLVRRAEMAFKDAVREVIEEHAGHGWPLYIWRGGKVIEVSGKELKQMAADRQ